MAAVMLTESQDSASYSTPWEQHRVVVAREISAGVDGGVLDASRRQGVKLRLGLLPSRGAVIGRPCKPLLPLQFPAPMELLVDVPALSLDVTHCITMAENRTASVSE